MKFQEYCLYHKQYFCAFHQTKSVKIIYLPVDYLDCSGRFHLGFFLNSFFRFPKWSLII